MDVVQKPRMVVTVKIRKLAESRSEYDMKYPPTVCDIILLQSSHRYYNVCFVFIHSEISRLYTHERVQNASFMLHNLTST